MRTVENSFFAIKSVSALKNTELPAGEGEVLCKACSEWAADSARTAGISEAQASVKGDLLLLSGCAPFVSPDTLKSAYGEFVARSRTIILTSPAGRVGAWLSCDGELPELDALDGEEYPLSGDEALVVTDARSLLAANETAAAKRIEQLLDAGVIITDREGIRVSPDATVEPGARIMRGSVIAGSSYIHKNAVIGPDSQLIDTEIGENTVFKSSVAAQSSVGAHSTIGPFTQLRPDSRLGDGVKVGDFVEIKNSNIGDGTSVAHLTYIGDADVGRSCNFGCGVVVVNYDGEKKYRSKIGDFVFVGCNTNLVSPVNVGDGAFTAAGSTITKDVPAGALAIERGAQVNKEGWAERKLDQFFKKHHRWE